MRLVTAAILALLAGCFSPKESDGKVQCGADMSCPPGFSCGAGNLCYRDPEPIDASSMDGPVIDAPLLDAARYDAGPVADASDVDALITECNDGIDNDCDGQTDFPNDPGCTSALDPSELGTKQCDDGIDNDGDMGIDFHQVPGCGPTDPQCSGPSDPQESQ